VANMARAGQLKREVKGKRTYRIVAVEHGVDIGIDRAPGAGKLSTEDPAMDYDQLAAALLLQAAQILTTGNQAKESDGSWARRRIERLERRIGELERDLSQSRAESKTLVAERDQLQLHLEHSEGNLALLTKRLSTGKSRDGQLSTLLHSDERALLHQLRSGAVRNRPDRVS
jgi:chromosome segregation ATPase